MPSAYMNVPPGFIRNYPAMDGQQMSDHRTPCDCISVVVPQGGGIGGAHASEQEVLDKSIMCCS